MLVPPIIEGVPWAQDCGDYTVVSETLEPGVAVTLEVNTESNRTFDYIPAKPTTL